MPRKDILYFTETGEVNLDETLKIAKERADELGIKDLVIASTRGNSALRALDYFKDYNLMVVPHVTGFRELGVQELSMEAAEKIKSSGGKIVIAAHTFSGIDRAIQAKWDTMYPAGIIAQTLRIFGQGMKVTCEIVLEAADAGYIRSKEPVISIAGTGKWKGSDTAIVVSPANSNRFFEMKVHEIIRKPRL